MSRHRIGRAGCGLLLLLAACGGSSTGIPAQQGPKGGLPTTAVQTITSAPETTIPRSTTSSASSAIPVVSDSYYQYAEFGLVLVEGSVETILVDTPVSWAASDFLGGVFYRDAEGETLWLRDGAIEAVSLGSSGPVGLLHGRATALFLESNPEQCPPDDYYWGEAFTAVDLVTGARGGGYCDVSGPDGGYSRQSLGGALILEIGSVEWGPWSDTFMVFRDVAGTAVPIAANPFPESCEPCELTGRLSPDGRFLAYRHRADAYWPDDGTLAETEAEWWSQSRAIPAVTVVLDLESGEELYRRVVEAWVELGDFDGRRIVQWDEERHVSTIVEIGTLMATELEGKVALVAGVAADVTGGPFLYVTEPGAVGPPPTAQPVVGERMVRFAGLTDPDVSVTAAGKYLASVDEAGAWSVVLSLNPGSNLATFTATDSAGNKTTATHAVTYEPPVELSAGGLGVVSFGDDAEGVWSTLTDLFGPPSDDDLRQGPFDGLPDGYASIDYFRISSWENAGLTVVFSDGAYVRQDGVPHMIAWQVQSPAAGVIATLEGLTIGTSVAELEAMYGESLRLGELDVCIATDFYIDEPGATNTMLGFLDGSPTNPESAVTRLAAGAWPGC